MAKQFEMQEEPHNLLVEVGMRVDSLVDNLHHSLGEHNHKGVVDTFIGKRKERITERKTKKHKMFVKRGN